MPLYLLIHSLDVITLQLGINPSIPFFYESTNIHILYCLQFDFFILKTSFHVSSFKSNSFFLKAAQYSIIWLNPISLTLSY